MSLQDSSGTSSVLDETWISWFCNMQGNQALCEVDKPFIEDSFNLFGLKQFVPTEFTKALTTIVDRQDPDEEESTEVSQSACLLYGLIHARFIITTNGLQAMQKKFVEKEFGECPRTYCNGQAVLPIGMADEPGLGAYKLFCPKCRDIYNCPAPQQHVDGAFFGTSFPHIFLMTYENCVPTAPRSSFVPRVFGFKIHSSSLSLPKKVVVLDGASHSDGGGSSDDLNFESSVENGGVPSSVHVRGGYSGGYAGGAVVYDLTNDSAGAQGVPSSSYISAPGGAASHGMGNGATNQQTVSPPQALEYAHNVSHDVSQDSQGMRGTILGGSRKAESSQREPDEAADSAKRQRTQP